MSKKMQKKLSYKWVLFATQQFTARNGSCRKMFSPVSVCFTLGGVGGMPGTGPFWG